MTAVDPPAMGAWQAMWIWSQLPPVQTQRGSQPSVDRSRAASVVLLRRTFELDDDFDPNTSLVPARCCADSRYVLWVNGAEVRRGPAREDPRRLRHDTADLAPHLRPGTNVVTILARHYSRPTPWWMPVPATFGLGGGAVVFECRLPDGTVVATDRSWRTHTSAAWSDQEPSGVGQVPIEVLDARELPHDWLDASFDDSGWDRATELIPRHVGWAGTTTPPVLPYGALGPNPLPALAGTLRHAVMLAHDPLSTSRADTHHDDPVAQVYDDEASLDGEARERRRGLASLAEDPERSDVDAPERTAELDLNSGAAVVLFDLGVQSAGTVTFEITAAAGTRFDLAITESLGADGSLHGGDQRTGLRYLARGHHDRFESLDPMGGRFVSLAIRGNGPVTVHALAIHERLFGAPRMGFACSDPTLERIAAVGRRTVDLCSQDAYLDCASREQRAWTGDFVVHQGVDLATATDWRLARRAVELAAAPRPDGMLPMVAAGDFTYDDTAYIPDWALHWIHALWQLWRHDGIGEGAERIRAHLGVAEGVLRWFEPFVHPETSLLTQVTGWVMIDWATPRTAGACAPLNALWARALREFAEMADWAGDGGRSAWARRRHDAIAEAFEAFWNPERGLYVEQILDGEQQPLAAQHATAAAVTAGIVPAERRRPAMERICDPSVLEMASWMLPDRTAAAGAADEPGLDFAFLFRGPPEPWWDLETRVVAAQPFFRYVVHDALVDAGLAGRVAKACRDWERLLDGGATTWREMWFGGTRCHAWSSTPTRDLIRATLGVTPDEPGYARARVAPAMGSLAEARAEVPTPHGPLSVEVDLDADRLRIDSPVPVRVVTTGVRNDGPDPGDAGEIRAAGRYEIAL